MIVGDGDPLAGQPDDPFDQQLRATARVVQHHHVAPPRPVETIAELLDHQSFVGVQTGLHALAVDARGLGQEDVDQQRDHDGRHDGAEQIARYVPDPAWPAGLCGGRNRCWCSGCDVVHCVGQSRLVDW